MTEQNFGACLDFVFEREGGYVDDPHDPGGATNMGITLATLAAWRGREVTQGRGAAALARGSGGDLPEALLAADGRRRAAARARPLRLRHRRAFRAEHRDPAAAGGPRRHRHRRAARQADPTRPRRGPTGRR